MIYVKFDTQSQTGLQTWIDTISDIIQVNISVFDPQFKLIVATDTTYADVQAKEWSERQLRLTSHYPNIRLLADKTAEVIGEVVSELYSSTIAYIVVSRFYFDANANPHIKQFRDGLPVYDEILAKDTLSLISFGVQACLREFVMVDAEFPKQLDDFIYSHLNKKITLTSVSSTLHITTNSLRVYLEQEFHCNLPTYVRMKKIEEAKNLLATTNLSCYEIAEIIGLDEECWVGLFKKQVSMSPAAYRLKANK